MTSRDPKVLWGSTVGYSSDSLASRYRRRTLFPKGTYGHIYCIIKLLTHDNRKGLQSYICVSRIVYNEVTQTHTNTDFDIEEIIHR